MGGREGERKRKKERVGCTKYQRTILQSKQDGGCHTAYPRLNATSYFESSSNASLSLPSPGVTPRSFSSKLERVPPDRMHRCHRYPPFFLASSPRPTREKQFRPANGEGGRMVARLRPSCFEFCERTASSLDAVLFNLEERKDIGGVGPCSGRPRLERKRKENRSIKFTRISYFKEIEGK